MWVGEVMAVIKDIKSTLGRRVKTHEELGPTTGFLVKEDHITARKAATVGIVVGYVPGHGGDVFWVRHDLGDAGAYMFDEFEFDD